MNQGNDGYEVEQVPVESGSMLSDGRQVSDDLLFRPTLFIDGARVMTGSGIKTKDDGTESLEAVVMLDLSGAAYTYVITPGQAEKLGAALITTARRSREEVRQLPPRRR